MRILGIDPGYDRLGIACLDVTKGQKESVVFSDCITTSPRDEFFARLASIGKQVSQSIDTFTPDHVVLEKLFFNTNQKTAMGVSEVRGAIAYIALSKNIPVFEYTPSQIKVAVTGYGKSSKEDVQRMVIRLLSYSKSIKHDDEYDALAVALTHSACYKNHQ